MVFVKINCLLISVWFILLFLHGWRFSATKYNYIPKAHIMKEVVPLTALSLNTEVTSNICGYEKLIEERTHEEIPLDSLNTLQTDDYKSRLLLGGEYKPKHCRAHFSTALIVPYRNRPQQLTYFLNFFHHFLQTQNIHYRIFIVEQDNDKPFNRARLLNIGAYEAMRLHYPCLLLHDVDLIPLNYANLYVCTKQPRHMSTNIDVFRFHLLYDGLFGGATAILSEQFSSINGMSNMFSGWGGEDDDFHSRLTHSNYTPCRYDPLVSKYLMIKHKKQTPAADRYEVLREGLQRYRYDGLNNITTSTYLVHLKPYFTHIFVPD